jgi:hypothetical protein
MKIRIRKRIKRRIRRKSKMPLDVGYAPTDLPLTCFQLFMVKPGFVRFAHAIILLILLLLLIFFIILIFILILILFPNRGEEKE